MFQLWKKKLVMVDRSASFYFTQIFYIDIAFYTTPPTPIFSIFDYILLTIHNKMFRVGAKT